MKKLKNLKTSRTLGRLFDFHQIMLNEHLYMLYQGMITHEIMRAFLSVFKFMIKSLISKKRKALRKATIIMIECLQNVAMHGANEKNKKLNRHPSIFLFGTSGNKYVIETGNLIRHGEITRLETRLDDLNKLDRKSLKSLYKGKLSKTSISKKGGAGLGLINVAILSGEDLEFNFKKINKSYSFFSLRIKIANN
ncbi:MAG: hypothetical protein IIA45_02910 [Bacteroidetes bacterium]|nr:hypothetical protein [Bacteroidota bacterium]